MEVRAAVVSMRPRVAQERYGTWILRQLTVSLSFIGGFVRVVIEPRTSAAAGRSVQLSVSEGQART